MRTGKVARGYIPCLNACSCTLITCSTNGNSASIVSFAPRVEPGRVITKLRPIMPAMPRLIMAHGMRLKVNMVVMRSVNDDELLRFVELTREHPVHVRFIEFMPFTGNHWGRERVYTFSEMLGHIGSVRSFEKLNDDPPSTAKAYRVPGWPGTFAVISKVTEPFCGDCDRLRLTAEGKMRNCLFAREETDLLSALRRGEDIAPLIEANVLAKHAMLGGLPLFKPEKQEEVLHDLSERPMVAIGG